MGKKHMAIIWMLCMAAALVLFWIGVGKPYTVARELQQMNALSLSDPRYAEIAARAKDAVPNYWIGAAAPTGLLVGSIILFSLLPSRNSRN